MSGLAAPAMKVPVQIEEFRMEVDMGAVASILNQTDYEWYFKYLALRLIEISFHAYTGALWHVCDIDKSVSVSMLLNHQTNHLVAQLGRCH